MHLQRVAPPLLLKFRQSRMTEQELIRGIISREREAIATLVETYQHKVIKTAYYFLGDMQDAEDVAQEVFLEVLASVGRFRGEAALATWISRITINVCLGILRKGKNRHYIALEDEVSGDLAAEPTPFTDPLIHASLEEQRVLVESTFDRMSEKQGLVVRLHDMEGYTIQEISEIIDCPAGTVKSRLFMEDRSLKPSLPLF